MISLYLHIVCIFSILRSVGSQLTLFLLKQGIKGSQCLDGSQAGFYYNPLLTLSGSDTWVIFLEGGGRCNSESTCSQRTTTKFGSSNYWNSTIEGSKSYSNSSVENPYFYNANHVFLPYCSGDNWVGQVSTPTPDSFNFYFNGHLIIQNTLDALMNINYNHTMYLNHNANNSNVIIPNSLLNAKYILVTGESAGGMGTVMNLDFINDYIKQNIKKFSKLDGNNNDINTSIVIKGAAIAGWFFAGNTSDQQEYHNETLMPPNDYPHYILLNDTIMGGFGHNDSAVKLWNAYLAPNCVNSTNVEPNWHCYSVHNYFPFIQTPIFILENKFDTAQLSYDFKMPNNNVTTNNTIKYVKYFGYNMEKSIMNRFGLDADNQNNDHDNYNVNNSNKVNGLFFASCFEHVTGLDVGNVDATTIVNGYNSSQIVGNWFWNLNKLPNIVVDNCINQQLPCNPTCSAY